MKKLSVTLILGIVCTNLSFAQNEIDALRYSMIHFGGTARYQGMAGAFGALGADLSVMATNPAGLARYTKSEFSFTPGYYDVGSETTYEGNLLSDRKGNLNISNIGIVGAHRFTDNDHTNWKSMQIGMSYNRLANFHNNITINGDNPNNTLLDIFAAEAAGIHPDDIETNSPFSAAGAYMTWLISPDDSTGSSYFHEIPVGGVNQTKTLFRSGSMGETDISFSGNYNDKLYIGATIGVPNIRYSELATHKETVLDDSTLALDNFEYIEDLSTRGAGINFKLGVLILPLDWMRIGLAVHSPTYLSLTDRWSTQTNSQFDDGTSYDFNSVNGRFNYNLRTPSRYIGSLAFVIMKKALISADYEMVDYASARLGPENRDPASSYTFSSENIEIQEQYTLASNLRVGTEVKIKPFSVRAGYAYYGSPYKSGLTESDPTKTSYSFGLGMREKGYFIDLAYTLTKWSEDYYLYDPVLVNAATVNNTSSNVTVTVGFRY
jgi:hypothetical protein